MQKRGALLILVLIAIVIFAGVYFSIRQNYEQLPLNTTSIFQSTASQGNNKVRSNFVYAARIASPAVVHIRTTYRSVSGFGSATSGSGSGVIVAPDGYIATNNHVVEHAGTIEVVLADRRSFAASLVGRDPNTDLALLKINGTDFPYAKPGNSDEIEIGEWVLAIGYPYSLNTTVTAGIVSAKGRNIGIINTQEDGASSSNNPAIESFIQTDAAINPGNSGGALVNTEGLLIGINTAIASKTGSYSGYAFAIPIALVKKILDDLKDFGKVKRGILGVSFPSPTVEEQYLRQQGINPGEVRGVFITGIQSKSAAAESGLKEGDIIQQIDGIQLSTSAEFSERIARHRPGDKIDLTYLRNNKTYKVSVTLKEEEASNLAENSASIKEIYNKLGARFSPLSSALKERYNLKSGVLVIEVSIGGFFYQLGIPEGTIIAYINGAEVNSPEDIEKELLKASNSRVQILAIAPDGTAVVYRFSFGV